MSKQLLPIYDKPMIYYPLTTLMLAGIKDILIISTPEDTPRFLRYWETVTNGVSIFGLRFSQSDGLGQAFIGREFIGGGDSALVLGDNVFYGHGLPNLLASASGGEGASVFAYHVSDPERFGVVNLMRKKRRSLSRKA